MKETITWRDVAHLAEHNDKIRIIYDVIKRGYADLRKEYGIE